MYNVYIYIYISLSLSLYKYMYIYIYIYLYIYIYTHVHTYLFLPPIVFASSPVSLEVGAVSCRTTSCSRGERACNYDCFIAVLFVEGEINQQHESQSQSHDSQVNERLAITFAFLSYVVAFSLGVVIVISVTLGVFKLLVYVCWLAKMIVLLASTSKRQRLLLTPNVFSRSSGACSDADSNYYYYHYHYHHYYHYYY